MSHPTKTRAAACLLLSVLLGCRGTGTQKTSPPGAVPGATNSPAATVPGQPGGKTASATIRPLGGATGIIVSVNERLRFVVVDYTFNAIPPIGRALGVFRAGQRIGDVRLGEQRRGALVTAEILAGAPEQGDQVFPE